eukprot:274898_1
MSQKDDPVLIAFAVITCIICVVIGLLFIYQCYQAYKKRRSSMTNEENEFYSPKIELVATLMILGIIYQQIDQFFHPFSSSLAAVIIHYLYFIDIIILIKYRCDLMNIQALHRYIRCGMGLSILSLIIDLISSVYFHNFVAFASFFMCFYLISLCYFCGSHQSFAINKTYQVIRREIALRMISSITALFMVSLAFLSIFIARWSMSSVGGIKAIQAEDDSTEIHLLFGLNLFIIIVSTYSSFGFTHCQCILCVFGCHLIQKVLKKEYEQNCTVPFLTFNARQHMQSVQAIQDQEKTTVDEEKEKEALQVGQFWYNQYLLSRDIHTTVFSYIYGVERSTDVSVPPCIAHLVGNYYGLETAELTHLVAARKYALTIGEHVDIECNIVERACENTELSREQKVALNAVFSGYDEMNATADAVFSQFARIAINSGKESLLKLIIYQWVYLQRDDRLERYKDSELLRDILVYAVNNRLYDTCELILSDGVLEYVMFAPRPQCLLDALKQRDDRIIMMILNGLGKVKQYSFVCDDAFKECIKMDHLQGAQCLVERKWHVPTQNDYQLAERYYGAIHIWLMQRSSASLFVDV